MPQPAEIVAAETLRLCDGASIHAAFEDGVVTLTGEVPNEARRRMIEQRLLQLEAVNDVRNLLRVTPPPGDMRAQLVGLLASEGVQLPALEVQVRDGALSLYGRAAAWFDRDAAERLAWTLPGVREVENHIDLAEGAVTPDDGSEGLPL